MSMNALIITETVTHRRSAPTRLEVLPARVLKDILATGSPVQVTNERLFYPRDAMLARVIVIAMCLSVRLSVRPSVRLSVTRRYCVKTKKASGMISSPSGRPKTLVFRRQISSPNSKGFPRTGASNKGRS